MLLTPGNAEIATEAIGTAWHIDHAEGIAIDADGWVWVGGEEGQVYRGRLDGEPDVIATLPGRVLGIAIDRDGNAFIADMTGPGIYRVTPDGAVDLVSDGCAERPARIPNHPVFLADGTLLWTDSGDWGVANGCVYATRPGGDTRIASTEASRFPNGIALSPAGDHVLVAESTLPGVIRMDVGPDGALSAPTILATMPGTVPDGVAFDAEGRALVSCWAPDAVFRIEMDGSITTVAFDPLRFALNSPTNIAFVPGSTTLVAANIGERYLSVMEYGAGAELLRPEVPWRA
ncbi:MAG: SMP-30/gluconolactonase/LRE family protein [Gemmatimonadetes bacterium]|nr:SMP-30/gluconolactonase/LRE family protein [Gemmatimonadota bacterium]